MSDPKPAQFLYHFDPVRPELATDPNAWTEAELRTAEAHFAYLKAATAAGRVLLAGRCQDGIGPAIVVFEVDSEAEARAFMAADPFVRDGLMRASLHPYRAALVRQTPPEERFLAPAQRDPRQLIAEQLELALGFCLKSAHAVPAKRANWAPADGSAKSALQVVHHVAEVNRSIADALHGEPSSQVKTPTPPDDYAAALAALERTAQALAQAIRTLPDERLNPNDPKPSLKLMQVGVLHLTYHWGQLGYLQTLWGDPVDHFLK